MIESDTFLGFLCLILPLLLYLDLVRHEQYQLERKKARSVPPIPEQNVFVPSAKEVATVELPRASPMSSIENEPPQQNVVEISSEEKVFGRKEEDKSLQEYMLKMDSVIQSMGITVDSVKDLRQQIQSVPIELSDCDLLRFLIARKGSTQAAKEMIEGTSRWRQLYFPIKKSTITGPLSTGCMFFHGKARDGSPICHFRNALYDKTKGSPEQYTLAIAYVINQALHFANAPSVVVFVHTSHVEGAVNGPADFSFIKPFVQTFSDNYPERLRQLIMYPFPWYGRASWAVIKIFIDKRTQDKVQLLPALSTDQEFRLPNEVYELIDRTEIPDYLGGTDTRPSKNMLELPGLAEE